MQSTVNSSVCPGGLNRIGGKFRNILDKIFLYRDDIIVADIDDHEYSSVHCTKAERGTGVTYRATKLIIPERFLKRPPTAAVRAPSQKFPLD